jgi:hypothetical protein
VVAGINAYLLAEDHVHHVLFILKVATLLFPVLEDDVLSHTPFNPDSSIYLIV